MDEYRFPVYRMYPGGSSYFKITGPDRFEEVKVNEWGTERFVFEAKIYPDRQLISDMLAMVDGHWLSCDEKTFDLVAK